MRPRFHRGEGPFEDRLVTRFHFRRMSTGEPHPSAAIGVLTAPTNSPEPGAAELGVLILRGKYFAFSRTFYPEDPDDPPASGELWVWDWQSGRAHYVSI